MQISERHDGEVTIVVLDGALTLGDPTTRLHDKINSLLHQQRLHIVLDLGKVGTVDSAGLGELIRSHVSAKGKGGVVKLANLSKKADDLLITTKLDLVFDRFGSVADALASFGH
jgi:anti-anti-sigma factor